MDVGGTRAAPAAAVYTANRPEPTQSGARAVTTELPRTDAVRATSDTRPQGETGDSTARAAREKLLRDFIRSRALVDPRTREVVFQSVNLRTGEVVNQFPQESMLRLREYVSTVLDKNASKTGNESTYVAKRA